jgi:outer membrane protein TolC
MKFLLPVSLVVMAQLASVASHAQSASGTTGLMGLRPTNDPKRITMAEAFRMAGERSTDLRIASARVDESKAQVTKAWALVLPNIALNADYTFNFPEQTASFGSPEQSAQQAQLFESIANLTAAQAAQVQDPVQRAAINEQAEALRKSARDIKNAEIPSFAILPAHVVTGNITAAMPLFNARSFPLLQNAYSAVEITRLSTRQAQAALLWAVARTYTQAVATQELTTTVAEQVESAQRQHTLIKTRFDQGYETSLAVERAELEVKKAQQQERQAKAGLRAAKAALASIIGVVEDFDVVAPAPTTLHGGRGGDELRSSTLPTPTLTSSSASFDALLVRAWESRIDLRVQKELLAIADRGRTDAWMRFLPSFQLVTQGRYTTNTAGFTTLPFTGAVIVQGSLPIFDGGQTIAAIDESNAKFSQEILKVRQLEESIERELRGTLDDLALKEENAVTLQEVADLAKRTADNAEALYQEGVARQTDVSDARFGAFAAAVDAQRARLELENARLGLAYAVGELATLIDADDTIPAPLESAEVEAAIKTMDRVQSSDDGK